MQAVHEEMAIARLAWKYGISPVMFNQGKVWLEEHSAKAFGLSRRDYAA